MQKYAKHLSTSELSWSLKTCKLLPSSLSRKFMKVALRKITRICVNSHPTLISPLGKQAAKTQKSNGSFSLWEWGRKCENLLMQFSELYFFRYFFIQMRNYTSCFVTIWRELFSLSCGKRFSIPLRDRIYKRKVFHINIGGWFSASPVAFMENRLEAGSGVWWLLKFPQEVRSTATSFVWNLQLDHNQVAALFSLFARSSVDT